MLPDYWIFVILLAFALIAFPVGTLYIEHLTAIDDAEIGVITLVKS